MVIPQKIVAGLSTKADKIRALAAAGFPRAEIAQFLGISYQHVRNTLVQGTPKPRSAPKIIVPGAGAVKREGWAVQRLIDAGFHLLGTCSLTAEDAFGYSAKAPTEAGVYAFAVDGLVTYVGLTRNGLRTRLGHYVYGHEGQKTSARVKRMILNALNSGRVVEVLVATPPALEWNGLPVDGAAGLETGLIRLIRPEWNQHGNR